MGLPRIAQTIGKSSLAVGIRINLAPSPEPIHGVNV